MDNFYNILGDDSSMITSLKSLEQDYLQGNYKEYINKLLEIKDSIPRDIFHLNLGTGQMKLAMYGPARYNLEVAKTLGLNNELLRNNLDYVKEQIGQKIGGADSGFFNQLFFFFREIPFQSILMFSLVISLIALVFYWRKLIKNYLPLVLILFFAYLPLTFKLGIDSQYKLGIALEDLTLYEGPSAIFKDVGNVPSGYKILMKNTADGWGLITYPAYKIGWVNLRNVGIIDI